MSRKNDQYSKFCRLKGSGICAELTYSQKSFLSESERCDEADAMSLRNIASDGFSLLKFVLIIHRLAQNNKHRQWQW